MSERTTGLMVKICLMALLTVGLLIPSCKKSEPADKAGGSEQKAASKTTETPKQPAATPDVSKKPALALGEANHPAVAPDTSKQYVVDANGVKLVLLDIKLPPKMFVGTPQNIQVPNLEKPLGKERPPFYAPEGTTNVALGKSVTGTDKEPIIGKLEMVTDGDTSAADGSYVELGPFVQSVTIDLGAEYNIYAVLFWHYHKQARVYYDVIVQVADDPDFITNVKTLFNNDIDNSAGLGVGTDMHYIETSEGKLVDAKGVKSRYVRLYSNGNNSNELNHYIEVEVFGKPAK